MGIDDEFLDILLIGFIDMTANQMVEKDGSSLWDLFHIECL